MHTVVIVGCIQPLLLQGKRGKRHRSTVPREYGRETIYYVIQQWQLHERAISLEATQSAMNRLQFVENPHPNLQAQLEAEQLPAPMIEDQEDDDEEKEVS